MNIDAAVTVHVIDAVSHAQLGVHVDCHSHEYSSDHQSLIHHCRIQHTCVQVMSCSLTLILRRDNRISK